MSTVTDLASVLDMIFIGDHTDGFLAWRAHALAMPWATIVERSGVDEATVRKIAELYVDAYGLRDRVLGDGLTQQKHAVARRSRRFSSNLMLHRAGNVGRKGAGLCPVRGHSNVQGDRTMGIFHLPSPRVPCDAMERDVRVRSAARTRVRRGRDRARDGARRGRRVHGARR